VLERDWVLVEGALEEEPPYLEALEQSEELPYLVVLEPTVFVLL
jgi:hypothetical protein